MTENTATITGTEYQLRKLLKTKKHSYELKIKNHPFYLYLAILFFGSLLCMIAININDAQIHKDMISQHDCSIQSIKLVNSLNLPWYNTLWLNIVPYIPLLLLAIGLSWVLHGIQFRILA